MAASCRSSSFLLRSTRKQLSQETVDLANSRSAVGGLLGLVKLGAEDEPSRGSGTLDSIHVANLLLVVGSRSAPRPKVSAMIMHNQAWAKTGVQCCSAITSGNIECRGGNW